MGYGKGDDEGLGSFETKCYAVDGIDEVRCATFQRAVFKTKHSRIDFVVRKLQCKTTLLVK